MALTLAQAILHKQFSTPTLTAMAQIFVQNSAVLEYLKFDTAKVDHVSWAKEKTLPTAAARAIGTEFTASDPQVEQVSESMKIYGTRFVSDRALVDMGKDVAITQNQVMQTKAVSRQFQTDFFKGAASGNNFTGLQVRIPTAQTITVATNGGALSLTLLDELNDIVDGNQVVLWLNSKLIRRLKAKARGDNQISIREDEWGRFSMRYDNIIIRQAGKTTAGVENLTFTETQGTSDVCTSAYLTSFDSGDGVLGMQTSPMHFVDSDRNKVDNSNVLEWLTNYRISVPAGAGRIKGITDAAIGD